MVNVYGPVLQYWESESLNCKFQVALSPGTGNRYAVTTRSRVVSRATKHHSSFRVMDEIVSGLILCLVRYASR